MGSRFLHDAETRYAPIEGEALAVNKISVAPGEGKCPSNILQETDWDLKLFPCLLPDGGNSLHTDLLPSTYFSPRRGLPRKLKFWG